LLTPSTSINSLCFVDGNNGYFCGDAGVVYKTSNGGITWIAANTGLPIVKLNSISFYNLQNGIVVGNAGTAYVTTNSGITWTNQNLGISRNILKAKYFTDGIALVGEYGNIFQKTSAGSWNKIDSKINTDVRGVSGTGITDVHVCGGGGFIRNNKSSNTNYLNFEINPMMANLVDVYFMNASTGYAVSSLNKAIIKTVNGGVNWTFTAGTTTSTSWRLVKATSGNIGNGFSLHPTNRDEIFLGAGNQVYRSLDRGDSWTSISTFPGGSCHSFYVSPKDTNLMLASCGSSGGNVYRSTNYGVSWTSTFTGTLTSYGMPLEMDQNHPDTVYLGPDNAAFKRSTDFGATWTNISGTFTFRSPCDFIIQYGNSNIMYCGDGTTGSGSGQLYKSTNAGVNWTLIKTINTSSEIPMIANTQLDTNLLYHTAWSGGGFWKTTDRWQTTDVQLATTGSTWATGICIEDPTAVGYIVYGSTSYISTNYGATFSSSNTGSSPNAGILFFDKATYLAQMGGGVYKMSTAYNVTSTPIIVTGLSENNTSVIPQTFELYQNYPNPFNPTTSINYDLPVAGNVKLTVYNNIGKEIMQLVNEYQDAGSFTVQMNGSELSSGVYYYRLSAGDVTIVKKMLLVK
jgi:photosystem II stability/assembly factor-like uncharacterized protein